MNKSLLHLHVVHSKHYFIISSYCHWYICIDYLNRNNKVKLIIVKYVLNQPLFNTHISKFINVVFNPV